MHYDAPWTCCLAQECDISTYRGLAHPANDNGRVTRDNCNDGGGSVIEAISLQNVRQMGFGEAQHCLLSSGNRRKGSCSHLALHKAGGSSQGERGATLSVDEAQVAAGVDDLAIAGLHSKGKGER